MEDVARAALVRALTQVFVHRTLTADEKREVARRLEQKIATLMAKGQHNDTDLARMAVKVAIREYRESTGVRWRVDKGQELLGRLLLNRTNKEPATT